MPANNKKAVQDKKPVVAPAKLLQPPGLNFKKIMQDALIEGYEDPVAFCKYFLDFEPYPAQEKFLRATRDMEIANLTGGNRVGKTLLAAAILLWRATYRYTPPSLSPPNPSQFVDYTAAHASITLDQANVAFNYVTGFAESKTFKPLVKDIIYSPFPEMQLQVRNERGQLAPTYVWARSMSNGGRFLLGHSFGYVSTDESAFQPGYEEIEGNVLMMRLADQGGALFRFSTPNGMNHFARVFMEGNSGKAGVYSQTISTWENPVVSRRKLEQMKEQWGEDSIYYRQNVLGHFVNASDFFLTDQIQALYNGVEYLDKPLEKGGVPLAQQVPTAPVKGATYVMGLDLGAAQDPTVATVFRVDVEGPAQLVYCGENKNPIWKSQRDWADQVYRTYRPVFTCIDATGAGASPAQDLLNENEWENVELFIFSPSSKITILTKLQDAVQRRKFIFPYVNATKKLVEQMSYYKLDDKRIEQDYVMSLSLCQRAYETYLNKRFVRTEIFDDLSSFTVYGGGEAIGGTDVFGPGTLFEYDTRSGIYVPSGVTYE